MILLDSNIFMYAAGAAHRHKQPSNELLQRIAQEEVDAAVDAEVLQEILHRYRAIRRWRDGRKVYDLARQIVPTVLPITGDILDTARKMLDRYTSLMARDALHAAACLASGAEAFCSYDRDFDRIADLKRVEPSGLI